VTVVGVVAVTDQYSALVADPAALEAAVGRALPADLYTFRPWGRRLLVVREEAPDAIKGIWIPDNIKEPPAVGWVAACGPLVGTPPPGMEAHFGGWMRDPVDLLCKKVVFGKYAGQALLLGDRRETSFESDYVVLDDLDVWGEVTGG
jgi:hypothetical protein